MRFFGQASRLASRIGGLSTSTRFRPPPVSQPARRRSARAVVATVLCENKVSASVGRRGRRHPLANRCAPVVVMTSLLILATVLSSCTSSGSSRSAAPVVEAPTAAAPGSILDTRALAKTAYTYPLAASPDGRYLVDQRGTPFFMVADSAQSMSVNLTIAEAEQYLGHRAAQGFNTINMNAMEHKFGREGKGATQSGVPTNRDNQLPFLKAADGNTYDGTWGAADLSTPNDAYFAYTDSLIQLANSHDMAVTLAYFYLGHFGGNEGWWADLTNRVNTSSVAYAFGRYLAEGHGEFHGFRNDKNLILVVGGDYTPPADSNPESGESRLMSVLRGMRDGGAVQLQAGDWDAPTFSTASKRFAPFMGANAVYAYGDTFKTAQRAYQHEGPIPAYLKETGYELEEWTPGDPASIRKYQWWAVLSGATSGLAYGHRDVWNFSSEDWNNGYPFGHAPWQSALDSVGAEDMSRMASFVGSISWPKLVPSGLGTMKRIVTSKNGSAGGDSRVASAAAPDGSLALAYLPPTGHHRAQTVTIDATLLRGPFRARWWDPTRGQFLDVSPGLSNDSQYQFTTPGNNSAGDGDWLLVLDVV
jgi:hypothetical protein